jgi:hypothetical protein
MRSKYRIWLTGLFLLASSLLLLLPASALAQPIMWYVNGVNGNDSNNCQTAETACKTIGHAISLALSGDSIVVAAATYTENLTIGISLTIVGSGASTTIIDGKAAGTVITIPNSWDQVTLSNVTIRNGSASLGAGIYNASRLTINSSTISGNRAWHGGGIANHYGTVTINNSTISGNSAGCSGLFCAGFGGGIYSGGTLTINNSTLSNNVAFGGRFSRPYGGGIFNFDTNPIPLTISSSTISGNSPGGVWSISVSPAAVLQNNIVANNQVANCSGGVASHGYNLSSDNTCNFNSPGDLNNHDPLLGPLQNNGGPTQTMALLPGSPANDGGNPAGCTDGKGHLLTSDQRGMPRPDKEDASGCDIGAFESQTD